MSRFGRWLVAITAGGLVLRVANILWWRPTEADCAGRDGCYKVAGDALYSHVQGLLLARGHGYSASAVYITTGEIGPGAGDPPLYPAYLAFVSALHGSAGTGTRVLALLLLVAVVVGVVLLARRWLGPRRARLVAIGAVVVGLLVLLASVVPAASGTQVVEQTDFTTALGDVAAHRLASAVLGAAAVLLLGLLGRMVGGNRVGLVAAALAAINPMLWINDGMLLSESLAVPLVVAAVLLGYRFWNHPTTANALAMGVAIGLAALTRAEAVLLLAFMVVPLAWGAASDWRRRLTLAGVAGGSAVLLLLPWFGYNLARFEEPTLMTSGTGAVLAAGSCDTAYYGEFVGYYGANCFQEYVDAGLAEWPPETGLDESERDLLTREAALRYIDDHQTRSPVVAVFRVGRMFDLYRPFQNTDLNVNVEGRGIWASKAGLWFYWASALLGAVGLFALWRARRPISPFVGVVLGIAVTAATTMGITRYRAPVDAVLMPLAALGVATLLSWPVSSTLRSRRRKGPDVRPDAVDVHRTPSVTEDAVHG